MYAPQPPVPLDGIGDETADVRYLFSYNLQRLASVSAQITMHDMLNELGLSVQEWRALAIIDFLGSAPMNLLAQRAGIQKSQASRLIANLERLGWIQRRTDTEDKRISLLSLTPEGRDLVSKLMARSRDRNRRMLGALDEMERRTLMTLLGKVTKSSLAYLKELKGGPFALEPRPEPASFFEDEASTRVGPSKAYSAF
jgi:DNA-binding MarR family transcriptional regulator